MFWLVVSMLLVVVVAVVILRRVRSADAPVDPAVGGRPGRLERPERPEQPSEPYEDGVGGIGGISFSDAGPRERSAPRARRGRDEAHDLPAEPSDEPFDVEALDDVPRVPAEPDVPPVHEVREVRDVPEGHDEAARVGGGDATPRTPSPATVPVPVEERGPVPAGAPVTAGRTPLPDDDVWDRILGMVRGEHPVPEPEPEPEAEPVPEPEPEPEPEPDTEVAAGSGEPGRERRCGYCREVGHDRRSCPQLVVDDRTP